MAINKHAFEFIFFFIVILFFITPAYSEVTTEDTFEFSGISDESKIWVQNDAYNSAEFIDRVYINDIVELQGLNAIIWEIDNTYMRGASELSEYDTSVTLTIDGDVVGTGIFGYNKNTAETKCWVQLHVWEGELDIGTKTGTKTMLITTNTVDDLYTYSGNAGFSRSRYTAVPDSGSKYAFFKYVSVFAAGGPGVNTEVTVNTDYTQSHPFTYTHTDTFNSIHMDRDAFNKTWCTIDIGGVEEYNETSLKSTDLDWLTSDVVNYTWTVDMYNIYGTLNSKILDFSMVPPQTEDTILWDADSYVVGDTGSYSWSASDDTWNTILYTIVATIQLDEVTKNEIELPLQTGTFYYNFLEEGNYEVRLRKRSALLPHVTIYTDSVTVLPIGPSYISVSETQITAGAGFDVEFSYGFTPSESYLSGVNAKRLMPDNSFAVEKYWSIDTIWPITANTLYNLSDTGTTPKLFQEGQYIFELVTFNEGVVAQSQLIDVVFVPQPPQYNITESSITVDEATYKMGDTLTGNIVIDNTNFTYLCYLEIYNYDYGFVTNTPQPIFKQVTPFSGILKTSDYDEEFVYEGVIPTLPGNNSARIITVNGSTRTVIAYDNFTVSLVNVYGYGLELSAYEACINDEITIKVTAPSASNVTIENPYGNIVKIFVLNGSSTISFRFPTSGQYIIELSKSGDAFSQAQATILISDCADDGVVTTPTDGDMDDMYKNIFNFMTLPAFWGILILLGFVGGLSMRTNRMGEHIVSGNALAFITFALINLFCIVGLFAPYTMYILVSTWIFAGIFFGVGKMLARGE